MTQQQERGRQRERGGEDENEAVRRARRQRFERARAASKSLMKGNGGLSGKERVYRGQDAGKCPAERTM